MTRPTAETDPNESSGNRFCGNCGADVIAGAEACNNCGSPIRPEESSREISGDYIPYCRACGVPVAADAARSCPKCGVTPLCREHYNSSTGTCSLCPPVQSTRPDELTDPGDQNSNARPRRPDGPWPKPAASVPCPHCGARIRQGVDFCPNCGTAQAQASENDQYAGFLVRLGAAIIDSLITGVPAAIITSFTDIPALGTVLSVVYYVIFTYVKGQTPGKMLLGVHVVDVNGHTPNLKQVILREVVGKAISAVVLLMGYLWIIWDSKKRGWHDYIGGTFVVKRSKSQA